MATYAQVMEALRNADASGATEDAAKLAVIAARLKDTDPDTGRQYDPDLPTSLHRQRVQEAYNQQQQARENRRTPIERAIGFSPLGVGEAALSTVTSIPAGLINAYAGGRDVVSPYSPRTESGQEYIQDVGDFIYDSGIAGLQGMGNIGKTMPYVRGVSRVADLPITVAAKGKQLANRAVAATGRGLSHPIGLNIGVGGEPLQLATKVNFEGNPTAMQQFFGNLRPKGKLGIPMTEVVTSARNAVNNLRKQKSNDYVNNMDRIKTDKEILDLTPITDLAKQQAIDAKHKGEVIHESSVNTQQKLADAVDHWASLDPTEFHTPFDLDKLKQKIGDIRDEQPYGTHGRTLANDMYHKIRQTIADQAPTYDATMSGYAEASDLVSELEKSLSLGAKSLPDTALRKLQSVLRNNANTNYGRRVELADTLENAGATNLKTNLAAQSLSSVAPRGLSGKIIAGMENIPVLAASVTNPAALLAMLPIMASESPRIMGETAAMIGKGARYLNKGVNKAGALAADAYATPIPYDQASTVGALTTAAQQPQEQQYKKGGLVQGYDDGGKVDLANSSKYIDGDSRVSNPYGYVLDDSNSRMDVSPRASLDSAVISDRANLVHNMVAERDRLSDKYLGGAGRFASKGLEKLRDALNSSPAFDESVLYPKSSNLKVGDFLIDEAPEALYDYTTRGLPSFVLGNEWVNNPATGGMMHTNPYADPRALAFLNAWGVETPIVAGAKAAYPLVKSGSKKLLKELATQYETGTGLGKYLIDPTMNIVEKDKGKIIRANDRGEEVTRASRTNKKTGQYVGAPPGVDSPQALGALVNDYVKGMDQGLPGRNFYTDSSSDILGRTGHNMTEADLLAQNLAILSRANNVGGNTTMSAKAHIQAATGEPIRTGRFPSKDSPPLQEMYDAGQAEYLGHKRDPFATQLGVAYAPERIGRGVNDMHEAELMGYPTGKVGGATQHSFMDEVRARAIDKANQTNLGGFNDWNTGNAQAAAWSGNKIRRGDISAGDAAKSYADYFPGHEANATYEAVSSPVTGHLQGLLDAPFEERLNYTLDPRGSWDTSASGRDIGYTVSGLLPGRSVNTVGRFKDSANPAIVARPVIGTETTATGERAMTPGSEGALNAVEASRAYFDAQEAAAWHKLMPAKNADAYTGAGLDFGRDFTKADMERIAPLFESKGYDIGSAPDGVTIMANSKTPKGKEFSKDIKKIIKDNKNAFHGVTTDFGALNSNYINYGDAWKSNIPGSVTKELLKYIDTAPVTGSKLEGSQLYRDTVKARNARDLAAEKSGLGKVRADMVRAREIFAKEGWNGLRKAAEAGIVPAVFLSPNAVPEDWR